jgi:hypothetical protein
MTTEELKQFADLSDQVIKLKAKIIKIRSELLASSLFEENEADESQSSFLGAAQTDANTVLVAGWISIETQMPPLNENVLVFDDFHRMNICKRMDEVGYKIWNTESIIIGITHWIQLPSKPACT